MEQTPITLPTGRVGPFDPPRRLGELRSRHPLTPLEFPDGHVGWLVTGYDAARAVLADPRFSARRDLLRPPFDTQFAKEMTGKAPDPGQFIRMDPPEHTRYRRLLIAQFTVRRIKQLEPRIAEVTRECLDAMESAGPPVDAVREFALPIPSRVICELLGVPYEDRVEFQRNMAVIVDFDSPPEEAMKANTGLRSFFGPLIAAKRRKPTDDFFSDLVNGGELTDEELTVIGLILFGAGFETTANMLGLGVFALLEHPDQLTALRGDPGLADEAVEELLRYLSIIHFGPVRAALEDIELEGRVVKKGQSVALSIPAANRDPARFEDPDRLDLTRPAHGHLSFGHGVHQCLGQQLARVEMRIALPALLERFPQLRIAVPSEDVRTRDRMAIYGVRELPVTW